MAFIAGLLLGVAGMLGGAKMVEHHERTGEPYVKFVKVSLNDAKSGALGLR